MCVWVLSDGGLVVILVGNNIGVMCDVCVGVVSFGDVVRGGVYWWVVCGIVGWVLGLL